MKGNASLERFPFYKGSSCELMHEADTEVQEVKQTGGSSASFAKKFKGSDNMCCIPSPCSKHKKIVNVSEEGKRIC